MYIFLSAIHSATAHTRNDGKCFESVKIEARKKKNFRNANGLLGTKRTTDNVFILLCHFSLVGLKDFFLAFIQ